MTPEQLPLAGKRIGLLTGWASRLGGGVFEAVLKHAELIRSLGGEPVVHAPEDEYSAADRPRFGETAVHVYPAYGPVALTYAPAMLPGMLADDLDLVHLHGIWKYPSRAGMLWARRTGRPYVVSPHGMLDPWIMSRGKLKKLAARIGYENASWRAASTLHALTPREASDIQRESGRANSLVIPNAAPPAGPPRIAPASPTFVYLGRIHSKKNIEALITAWRTNNQELEALGATLAIAGWGEEEDVAALYRWLEGAPASIRFLGPQYGEDKARLLREAHHLVLPSHSEGLPMVILEAWTVGTPTLMTEECNLPEGFTAGAANDCGYDAATIGTALIAAARLSPDTWLARSTAAAQLAVSRFSNQAVAGDWALAYANLIQGNTGLQEALA